VHLAQGRLDLGFITAQFGLQLAQAGKLKVLALTTNKPLTYAPGIPNLHDIGVPGLEGLDPLTFSGFLGPAGVPTDVVRKFNSVHNEVIVLPDVVARFRDALRSEPVAESPEGFRRFVEAELAKWTEMGRKLKVQIQ